MERRPPIFARRSRPTRRTRRRLPLAQVLAGPATAGRYPGFSEPAGEDRMRAFLSGSAAVHALAIALLALAASMAPTVESPILHLRILDEKPPPPREEPKPPLARPLPPPPIAQPVSPPIAKPVSPPPPEPVPVARPAPPPPKAKPARPEPQIDRVAAPVAPTPPPTALPRRAEASKRSAAPTPEVAIDRIAPAAALEAPSPRRAGPRLEPARAPRPARDVSPAPAVAVPAAPAPVRTARERSQLPARSGPAPRRPNLRPAGATVAPAPVPAPAPVVARAPVQRRAAPAARPAPLERSRAPEKRSRIPGVSLGSLAPCVSDAREQKLKQRVVAAVANRTSCGSPAGRFHFLETKNVNAFLMGIERAPGRLSGDRCEELAHALDCLDNAS